MEGDWVVRLQPQGIRALSGEQVKAGRTGDVPTRTDGHADEFGPSVSCFLSRHMKLSTTKALIRAKQMAGQCCQTSRTESHINFLCVKRSHSWYSIIASETDRNLRDLLLLNPKGEPFSN